MKKIIIIILFAMNNLFSYVFSSEYIEVENEFIYDNKFYNNCKVNFGFEGFISHYNSNGVADNSEIIINYVYSQPNFTINTDFNSFFYGLKLWEYFKLAENQKINGYRIKLINIENNSYKTYYEPISIKLFKMIKYNHNDELTFYSIIGPEVGFEIIDFHNNTTDNFFNGGVFGVNFENYFQYKNFSINVYTYFKNTGNYFTSNYLNQFNFQIIIAWFKYDRVWKFINIVTDEMTKRKIFMSYEKNYFLEFDSGYDKLSINISYTFD